MLWGLSGWKGLGRRGSGREGSGEGDIGLGSDALEYVSVCWKVGGGLHTPLALHLEHRDLGKAMRLHVWVVAMVGVCACESV